MPQPICHADPRTQFQLAGPVGQYLAHLTDQWLLPAPAANPAMLEMFRDRDAPPLRDLVPWAGEFAGKYLTSATQVLRLTSDPRLRRSLGEFVDQLIALQAEDGYLGPWPQDCRLTNSVPHLAKAGLLTWDTWSHYHVLLGLLLWHRQTGDRRALAAAVRMGDLLCAKYLGAVHPRLVDTGSTEMNLAPAHGLALLYRQTGEQRYLDLALQLVDEFAAETPAGPLAGDYLRQGLADKPFYATPKPRWESLHPIMALAELYWITGSARFRQAFEALWWSMLAGDRHNNGGFTSGEKATGNPYDRGAIETCCTIAWLAMSVEMLKLTGDSIVADEIELSTFNAVMGLHSASGRWATYNTPMDGQRRASAHHIVFQARPGSPELNCCSVNSPRGFGLLSEWALLRDADGLRLNYYGPGEMTAPLRGGVMLRMTTTTRYPLAGTVDLVVSPSQPVTFTLKLRIPYWSQRTRVSVNGRAVKDVRPGEYLALERRWRKGDRIRLVLDLRLHAWSGEAECQGKAALYRGPLLLAFDHRYNLGLAAGRARTAPPEVAHKPYDAGLLSVPPLDVRALHLRRVTWHDWLPPLLLLETTAADGRPVRLCDFASAGEGGSPYATWLPVTNAPPPMRFTRANPLRSQR